MPEPVEISNVSKLDPRKCFHCGHDVITETMTKEVEIFMVGGKNIKDKKLETIIVAIYCSHCRTVFHK